MKLPVAKNRMLVVVSSVLAFLLELFVDGGAGLQWKESGEGGGECRGLGV